jgi:hypothetical protein
MKQPARLIIPAWGDLYVGKILSVTLPAVLAPGNLPALCESFEVELTIVTESRLFEVIRGSKAFKAAAKICKPKLIPLDDLLTDVASNYGIVLTFALFRGFADLGPRMTETYLLFLNADFIVSNGSLRHVGGLMRQGKRLIHAPSFRVVFEDVSPQLHARVDMNSSTLNVSSREMAKLALTHKHPTVQARTVNQRLSHQKWMDQFYWYVDEDTLIGYQSPVALVAIKPERVVLDPILVWDFAFIPEAAPTLAPHFITDSDDFLMIEPQSRETGSEMIRTGWVSIDEIAHDLSLWLTKEHRESNKQLLKIHASDLPATIDTVIQQSRAYMAEIHRRMSPVPAPHRSHPRLGQWFEAAKERRRALQDEAHQQGDGQVLRGETSVAMAPIGTAIAVAVLKALQTKYRKMIGSLPDIRKSHPLWLDAMPVNRKIAAWEENGKKDILWIKADEWRRYRLYGQGPAVATGYDVRNPYSPDAPYDGCICELTFDQLPDLKPLYADLRPLIKDGGCVVFNAIKSGNVFARTELFLDSCNFPDIDISEIHFYGTATTGLMRALYVRAMRPVPTRPIVRAVSVCALILLAPLVRLANVRADRRDSAIFPRVWTTLVVQFTVKRARRLKSEGQANAQRLLALP